MKRLKEKCQNRKLGEEREDDGKCDQDDWIPGEEFCLVGAKADFCLTAFIMLAGEKEKMPGVWCPPPMWWAGRAGGEAVIPTETESFCLLVVYRWVS